MPATKPYVIGLTGATGSGKTEAAKYLESLGAARFDADEVSHQVTAPGGAAFRVAPKPGKYRSFRATVPVGEGSVTVEYDKPTVTVRATVPGGVFFDGQKETPLEAGRTYGFVV